MAEYDDLDLVNRCLAGDTKAFEILIERYQKPVFNVALRMLNDLQDAEDVTQVVFIKVYEKLDTFKSKFKFFSWVYRMAVNESLNFIKREKRYEGLNVTVLASENDTESAFTDFETKEQVELALMFLQPAQRAIVVLKHFHGLSYQEIAYIMDIPEKTVKSRLYESRQQLRKIFYKQGYVQ
jgi:RNA polymerase sigma-70 factor (ECF subfamily)